MASFVNVFWMMYFVFYLKTCFVLWPIGKNEILIFWIPVIHFQIFNLNHSSDLLLPKKLKSDEWLRFKHMRMDGWGDPDPHKTHSNYEGRTHWTVTMFLSSSITGSRTKTSLTDINSWTFCKWYQNLPTTTYNKKCL